MQLDQLPLSADSHDRIDLFLSLLEKWRQRLALIGGGEKQVWDRHVLDSLQLLSIYPQGPLYDLGSGAGFPGMVLALAGRAQMVLIEKNYKKYCFLKEVKRQTGVDVKIVNRDFTHLNTDEEWADLPAITARALAPLPQLIQWAHDLLSPTGVAFFFKGENALQEIEMAQREWAFSVKIWPSTTHSAGKILQIENIKMINR